MAEAAFTLKLSPRLFWGGEKCFGPGIAELLGGGPGGLPPRGGVRDGNGLLKGMDGAAPV